jgi:ABC-type Fe3+-hydroxamate transport system substrate-binding protein
MTKFLALFLGVGLVLNSCASQGTATTKTIASQVAPETTVEHKPEVIVPVNEGSRERPCLAPNVGCNTGKAANYLWTPDGPVLCVVVYAPTPAVSCNWEAYNQATTTTTTAPG